MRKSGEMHRSDFTEEGPHQWVFNFQGYRFAVRKNDGMLEISIKAKIRHDPTLGDWDVALRTFNEFLKKEVIARDKEIG